MILSRAFSCRQQHKERAIDYHVCSLLCFLKKSLDVLLLPPSEIRGCFHHFSYLPGSKILLGQCWRIPMKLSCGGHGMFRSSLASLVIYMYIYISKMFEIPLPNTATQHDHTRQTPTQPINQVNQPINQPTNQPNNKLTKQPNNHKQTHQSTHSHFSSPQTFSLST